MKKILILISLLFILTSCLSNKNQEVINSNTETLGTLEKVQDEVILPPNEKTTKTEEDFSKDLQDLLKTIEENEQK